MITSKQILEATGFFDPHVAVSELLGLYDDMDFMKAVVDVAMRYKVSPMTIVQFYIKHTGTLPSELPDGYGLKDFKQ